MRSVQSGVVGLVGTSILGLALAACGGSSSSKSTPVSTSSTPAPATAIATFGTSAAQTTETKTVGSSSGAEGELTSVYQNILKLKSFRATISTGGTSAVTGTMEEVLPDKFHLTLPGGIEVINIGNDSYSKSGATWTKSTSTAGPRSTLAAADITNQIKALQTAGVAKGGTDSVNGKTCQIYTSGDTEYCIDSNKLPLRIVTGTGTSKATIIFTDFNTNIDIKAPI
jgi:hypothetical protein